MSIIRTFYLLTLAGLLLACGESKEDLSSRQDLSTLFREINALLRDFNDNKKAEQQLTLLKVRDHYSEYTKDLRDIRRKLAVAVISERFHQIRSLADSIISQAADFVNTREAVLLSLFDVSNSISRHTDYMADSKKYASREYGRTLSLDYEIKALEENIKFIDNKATLRGNILLHDSLSRRIVIFIDSLNSLAKQLEFSDTLNFHSTVLDTSDFVHLTWKKLESFDLEMPD